MPRLACLAAIFAGLSGAAHAQTSWTVKTFVAPLSLDAAHGRIKSTLARCWKDELDSRVIGLHFEHAEMPPVPRSGGVTIRLSWHRGEADKPRGLLQRAFDIELLPDPAGTRVRVIAHIRRPDLGDDVEAWLKGRERCFAGRNPSPER